MATLRTNWKGVFPPLVTPFTADGAFCEATTRRLVDLLIEEGVHGLIAAGSTGEWFSLDDAERVRLFEVVKDQAGDRVWVLGGTSAIATHQAVALTRAAKDIGLDGAMVLPPPYAMPSRREIIAHFEAIAGVGLPIMLYNNPPRTGINIDPAMGAALAEFDTVVAFKDSTKDLYQMGETIYALSDRIAMFAGLEPYIMANMHRGAVGTVSMIANVCAPDVVEYYEHAAAGRWDACARAQRVVDECYHLLAQVGAPNYAFVKEAMAALGRPGGHARGPYLAMEPDQRRRMVAGLAEIAFKGQALAQHAAE